MSRDQVGSVAEEAAKLFATLKDSEHQDSEHRGHRSGPECQWCPVCQLISLVRHARPETVDQLAAAATGVLGSLRGLLDAAAESARAAAAQAAAQAAGQTGGADADAEPDPAPRTDPRAERIDVSEDPEPWD